MTREEVLAWVDNRHFPLTKNVDIPVPVKDMFLCPKSDRCVMECYHKTPHEYEEKFCNDIEGKCGVKCVHELISDCTFFEEDFEL